MLDFNDFQPIEDSSNQNPLQQEIYEQDINGMNNILQRINNPNIDEEEQKRILDRQKEAEERKAKINKKIREEEESRMEIRKKAAEYLVEFEMKRKDEIAKKRKELEEKELNQNKEKNTNDTTDSWFKVSGNIDLKDSDYKGSKDVQRMREAMMNRKDDPNSEPVKYIFG